MRPVLGSLELQQVERLTVDEDLVLAHHQVAALDGDFLQELGRRSARLTLGGVASGAEAATHLESLREAFRSLEPVDFTADIATATRIGRVLIEDMAVRELAGKPARFEYALTLRQYTPPPPEETEEPPPIPPVPPPPVDTATLIVEVVVEGDPDFDYSRVQLLADGVAVDAAS
ncbi:MAG TPA: hypothetical protein VG318_13605 [Actinomycetota bacterium]|nr:hypothetical protein [Actinomycetota bacterium]